MCVFGQHTSLTGQPTAPRAVATTLEQRHRQLQLSLLLLLQELHAAVRLVLLFNSPRMLQGRHGYTARYRMQQIHTLQSYLEICIPTPPFAGVIVTPNAIASLRILETIP
ncbi:hypothetical protein BASA61_008309 [Batrachochytrium salamandrivorans]|nr:hypothetical protein BASA61_008309 [Batrachochytrium salamandrivorans]KAH9252497.1 hypothetical protein BASA81_009540 [Batrachochytrium salamandrivorans]